MHRGTKRTSYIPFLLNPETRLDVIPVRLHFCETIPQARQPISHRKVCVNNGMVSITHFKVSHGDIISFQENDARTRGEKIRRYFDIEISVKKILKIGYGYHPNLRRTFHFLRSSMQEEEVPRGRARRSRATTRERIPHRQGDRRRPSQGTSRPMQEEDLERVLQQLRSSMQEEDLERAKKFGSKKVCLGSSFAEHNRIKRNLYHFKSLFLSKRRNEKNRNIPTRTVSPIVDNFVFYRSTYCSAASPRQKTMKRKRKRIELPTHYSEVNHRTLKAVVSYGPNIGHIPHDIRLKDLNLLLRSGNGRGQNI